jgi:hypothetical protein
MWLPEMFVFLPSPFLGRIGLLAVNVFPPLIVYLFSGLGEMECGVLFYLFF